MAEDFPLEQIKSRVLGAVKNSPDFWAAEKTKEDTLQGFLKDYVLIVAAVPPLAGFLAGVLYQGALFSGIRNAVLEYVFSLIGIFIITFVTEKVVEFFGGAPKRVTVLKYYAFVATPGWVAGLGHLIPVLGWLVMFAASLYGIYLWWTNFQLMTDVPEGAKIKAAGATIAAAVVVWILLGSIFGALMIGGGAMGALS